MDQLNAFFTAVKTHRFWISCGVVFLLTVGFGAFAYSKQGTEIEASDKAIKSAKQSASTVISAAADIPMTVETDEDAAADTVDYPSVHPNNKTVKGMEDQIQTGKKQIVVVWKSEFQKQQPFLKWPDTVFTQVTKFTSQKTSTDLNKYTAKLYQHFPGHEHFDIDPDKKSYVKRNPTTEELSGMRPEEQDLFAKYSLSETQLKLIGSYIAFWLPQISEESEATWELPVENWEKTEQEKVETLFSSKKKLVWRKENQQYWLDRCTKIKGFAANTTDVPHVSQLVYIQEDLAVLRNVMRAIGKTNEEHPAAVRVVREVLTGRDAIDTDPFNFKGDGLAVYKAGEGGGLAGNGLGTIGGKGGDGGGGGAQGGGDKKRLDPSNDRYVDRDFYKIDSEEFRLAVKGQGRASTDGEEVSEDAWQIVFRRLPVRVRILVDERHIDAFLAQCANAPMPINVREIAMMPGNFDLYQVKETEKKSGGGGGGGKGAGPGGGSPGAGLAGGSGGASNAKGSVHIDAINAALQEHPEQNTHFYVPLEIYGTVRLYNRPNEGLFQNGEDGADE